LMMWVATGSPGTQCSGVSLQSKDTRRGLIGGWRSSISDAVPPPVRGLVIPSLASTSPSRGVGPRARVRWGTSQLERDAGFLGSAQQVTARFSARDDKPPSRGDAFRSRVHVH